MASLPQNMLTKKKGPLCGAILYNDVLTYSPALRVTLRRQARYSPLLLTYTSVFAAQVWILPGTMLTHSMTPAKRNAIFSLIFNFGATASFGGKHVPHTHHPERWDWKGLAIHSTYGYQGRWWWLRSKAKCWTTTYGAPWLASWTNLLSSHVIQKTPRAGGVFVILPQRSSTNR